MRVERRRQERATPASGECTWGVEGKDWRGRGDMFPQPCGESAFYSPHYVRQIT